MSFRYGTHIVANKIQTRGGAIKMVRRGPLAWRDQRVGDFADRAPDARGIWAFVFPYFDDFFAWHKWDEVVPKRFRRDSIIELEASPEERSILWQEREAWIKSHRDLMPIRNFWWEGSLYSRFDRVGRLIDADRSKDRWMLMGVNEYADVARHVEPGIYGDGDHMEVFLSPRHGRVVQK